MNIYTERERERQRKTEKGRVAAHLQHLQPPLACLRRCRLHRLHFPFRLGFRLYFRRGLHFCVRL